MKIRVASESKSQELAWRDMPFQRHVWYICVVNVFWIYTTCRRTCTHFKTVTHIHTHTLTGFGYGEGFDAQQWSLTSGERKTNKVTHNKTTHQQEQEVDAWMEHNREAFEISAYWSTLALYSACRRLIFDTIFTTHSTIYNPNRIADASGYLSIVIDRLLRMHSVCSLIRHRLK